MNQAVGQTEMRQFGFLVGGVFVAIGLWPLLIYNEPVRLWGIGAGLSLIILGGLAPRTLVPIHKGWMWIGHVLGLINTRILLGVIFYGVITPMGVIFRIMGKDDMRRAFAEGASTYRVIKTTRPRSHMKFQF